MFVCVYACTSIVICAGRHMNICVCACMHVACIDAEVYVWPSLYTRLAEASWETHQFLIIHTYQWWIGYIWRWKSMEICRRHRHRRVQALPLSLPLLHHPSHHFPMYFWCSALARFGGFGNVASPSGDWLQLLVLKKNTKQKNIKIYTIFETHDILSLNSYF